jgi:hypothetical protein
MVKHMKTAVVTFLFCVAIIAPIPVALAAESGAQLSDLVSCDGVAVKCDWCTLVQLIDNVIDWLFTFFTLAAVAMVMYVGFKLVTSGGNSSAWEEGKSMFTNLVIGFVIFLSAWLIVDTILKGLIDTNSDFGVWNELGDCGG